MSQTNNPTSGPGGRNRNPNTGGKPSQPKLLLKAYHSVQIGANNSVTVFIDVAAFLAGQPLAGQEVTLKEGFKVLDTQNLDTNGEVLLRAMDTMADREEVKTLRVCLSGYPDEKNLTVTIPAIKKVKHTKKMIAVTATTKVDQSTGTCSVVFNCLISEEDTRAICAGQRIALLRDGNILAEDVTDGNGRKAFALETPLRTTEKTDVFRVVLPGLTDEAEVVITVPAKERQAKEDNDPEAIILRRYHDGCGNFKVIIRVIKHHGIGVEVPVTIWYRGEKREVNTEKSGEVVFLIPEVVDPGEEEKLVATVSGIAEEATIDIKRRKLTNQVDLFSGEWWLGTNNGRALILMLLVLLTWIITVFVGVGEPNVNHRMFNDESGLSTSEQFYNQNAALVDRTYVIEPSGDWSTGRMAWWGWLSIITFLIIFYSIFSLREEIAAGIEEGFEKLFDKSYSKAGDPAFEKLAKIIGSYRVARNSSAEFRTTSSSTGKREVEVESKSGRHPSLMDLFKLDLLSDTLVSVVPAIIKRIF